MSNFNYDSYCGNYCGACSIILADKTGNKDPLASYWTESALKDFQQAQGIELSAEDNLQLRCKGCKSDTLFINCKHCKIRACAISRKVEHCNGCNEYPCQLLKGSLMNKDIQEKLPHLKVTSDNLTTIKNVGVEQWLNDQEKQWKCPECQTDFSWYTSKCTKCGKDLDKIKDYNNLEI
ncbi:MAG TPA: DUF3795 domain-containing protein [Desulfosporosinus sp.]